MSKVSFQMPIAKYHGRAKSQGGSGGIVLWTVGDAAYGRSFVNPAQPDAVHQTQIRAYLASAAGGYKALSAAQAAAWVVQAALIDRTNPVGGKYTLSGIAYYCMVNQFRQMDGQALTPTALAPASPAPITGVTSATVNGANLDVVVTYTSLPAFLVVRVTPDLGSAVRQARPNEYRFLSDSIASSIVAGTASPQTISVPIEYFTVAAAEHIGVEVLTLTNNYQPGTPFREKNVLVA